MIKEDFEKEYGKVVAIKPIDGDFVNIHVTTERGKVYKVPKFLEPVKTISGIIIEYMESDERNLCNDTKIWLDETLERKMPLIKRISKDYNFTIYTDMPNLVSLKNSLTVMLAQEENESFLNYVFNYVAAYVNGKNRIELNSNLKIRMLKKEFYKDNELDAYVNKQNRAVGDPKEFLETIMKRMCHKEISDCSLAVNSKVKYRQDKELEDDETFNKLTVTDMIMIQDEILNNCSIAKRDKYFRTGVTRVSMQLKDYGRYRVVMSPQRGTPSMSIRYIPFKIRDMGDFRLPKIIKNKLLGRKGGLYIIAGVPNSGKSTLAASVIDQYTLNEKIKITTLENPVEYLFRHNKGQVTQHEIGEDIISYSEAIEMLLTFDPDIVYITEIKNKDEILNAIEMSVAGKFVVSSFHAGSVEEALTRARGMLSGDEDSLTKFSMVLQLIIVQNLIPKKGGGMVPTQEILNILPNFRKSLKDTKMNSLVTHLQNQRLGNRLMENDLWNLLQDDKITKEVFDSVIRKENFDAITPILYRQDYDLLEDPLDD